jgi:enterochelin esterase-like enzyme
MPPVLVLFDGQNVLGDHGSHAGGWHAHEAVNKLPKTIRRPVIVAVDHGGLGRMRELWSDLDAFLHFVMHRVLPMAEKAVGRAFDPRARVVGGASMGGLASLGALARHPHFFEGAIAMSPSAWVVPVELHQTLRHARLHAGTRIYLDVGERESERMVREARHVAHWLERHLPASHRMWRPDKRGKHREADWRRRLPKALRFMFRRAT